MGKKYQWFDEERRGSQVDDPENLAKGTCFGYERVGKDEKVKLVLRHFNAVARKYDFMNTLLSFGIHLLWKRSAIKMLGLKAGDQVIDLCGGTGDLSIWAARAITPGGHVILYDMNWTMMQAGRPKVWRSPFGRNIFFVQGDAERISFHEQCFEAAMVGFGIRNLTDMEAGLKEMYRVLKPDGKLMCLEFSKPTAPLFRWLYDFYSFHIMPLIGWLVVGSRSAYTYLPESIRVFSLPDELSATLKKVGFSRVTYRKLTNGIAVVHLARKGTN